MGGYVRIGVEREDHMRVIKNISVKQITLTILRYGDVFLEWFTPLVNYTLT